MTAGLPAEFALMTACCRWPPSAAREAAVAAAASAPIDWARFERIVATHRVAALVHDGLRRADVAVPPPAAGRLADAAAAARHKALAMAREALRLQHAFDAAGIPALFVKGSSLAILAYGDLGIKQAWDIDLLIAPESALAGRKLLERMGYVLAGLEGTGDAQFVRMADFTKECIFENSSHGTWVELHWGLADNRWLLPGIGARSAAQEVEIGGAKVRTLADEALFAYLCAHGTTHAWARFKWLADVGAWLSRADGAEIERRYRAAQTLGAGRGPAVALLLCERLLGLEIPPALRAECRADRRTRALAAMATRCLTWRGGEREIRYFSSASLWIWLSRLLLVPGRRYLWSEIGLRWNSPTDRVRWALPRPLGFLYHLLRVPLWLGRFGKRLLNRAT